MKTGFNLKIVPLVDGCKFPQNYLEFVKISYYFFSSTRKIAE